MSTTLRNLHQLGLKVGMGVLLPPPGRYREAQTGWGWVLALGNCSDCGVGDWLLPAEMGRPRHCTIRQKWRQEEVP